jgi:hypothetical protein
MNLKPKTLELSPSILDEQSEVKIDKWIDINSEECKDKDDNLPLTKKWLKWGIEDNFLFADRNGRVWGKGNEGKYYPYHLEYGKKLYGIRLAQVAAN